MWQSSRSSHVFAFAKLPFNCSYNILISIIAISYERPSQRSPCGGLFARRASDIEYIMPHQNVKKSLSLFSIIVHTGDARKSRRPKANNTLFRQKRKPLKSFEINIQPRKSCVNKFCTLITRESVRIEIMSHNEFTEDIPM